MTSAVPPTSQNPLHAQELAAAQTAAATGPTSPLSGAVPAQQPGRSYASAITATPTPPTPAGASAPAQNAKSVNESPVNGTPQMAQGGPQVVSSVPNGTPSGADHGRKPSVVISASGASGYTPNGGPVGQNGRAPPISFGSINAQGSPQPATSSPYQSQTALSAPSGNPRVTSPTHSPVPIPQPPVSGGHRPPSSLQQSQSNGMTFGSMGGDIESMRPNQLPAGPLGPGAPMHERRQSSQSSMPGDMSNMNRGFPPNGRGRGYPAPAFGAPSPAPNFRQTSNPPPRSGMAPPLSGPMPPGSPYNRGRNSPAVNPANLPPQHMAGGPPMQYGGYNPAMGHPTHPQQGMYPPFDPNSGFYSPYPWYGHPQPSPSPRPQQQYAGMYGAPQGQPGPPFFPQQMSRSASTTSERPPSSMGHVQTPSMQQATPASQTPSNQQANPAPSAASQFVRPKKTNAIKITDANGNEINFGKPAAAAPAAPQPQTPVIVSTPSAPTPPPRAPSSQHTRSESKAAPPQTAEERKNAFQEQIKRQVEEDRRKNEEAEAAKAKAETATPEPKVDESAAKPEAAQNDVVKEATVEAEKAAAVDAGDADGVEDAEAAESAIAKDEEGKDKDAHEETEDERLEREIAEMEAAEKEEEEREKAYQEKKQKEKAEAAAKKAEEDAKADEELKRQELEAEEREKEREREREAEKANQEPDEESRELFAALKKPEIGPGALTPASGTETPLSEDAEESTLMPPPAQPVAVGATPQSKPPGTQKQKPANLRLETSKRVEPSEPTPGMQALKSARFLELKEEPNYPDGFKSPNPALNLNNGTRKARAYDKDFLLQFQHIFKEKPSVDWDQKVRETLGPGDEPGSARPQSARTPSTNMSRQASNRPGGPQQIPNFGGQMGHFGNQAMGPRTLPPGTTSAERFAASQQMGGRPPMGMPQMGGRVPSQLGMNAPAVGMSRTNSLNAMANMQSPGSPRVQGSTRGGNRGSRRGDRTMSKKEEAEMAAKMPLTAHMEITPLEKSGSGWKASSIGQPLAAQHDLSGNMAPDMVQRKVKAALNKMTPEKFDKISDQILEIAAQSKNESDGRTLRQVIQLTFEKACDEAHWAGMYAQFCNKMLTSMSTEIRDETIKDKAGNPVVGGALFRKYLLNRCQEEFERGWQVNLPDKPEGESGEAALLSDEYYIAAAAKRRGLGLIQFIGQLYKLRMLTLRIMHECVQKLLNFEGDPDEAAVENLTTLLKSVGATMEEDEQGPSLLNAYFERIDNVLLKSDKLPSRPRFMVMDLIDLRKAGWKGKDDAKGPKTITQIHEEAEAAAAKAEVERQRQAQRAGQGGGRPPPGRGDSRNFSGGAPPPVDYQKSFIGMDDLRKLQNRGPRVQSGASLGPGGNLGPGSMLGPRTGSRRGAGNLAPSSSGNTTRTNTPPVGDKDKKDEQSSQNAFGALAALDPSGEAHEDAAAHSEAASPPAARNRSVSPLAAEKAEET